LREWGEHSPLSKCTSGAYLVGAEKQAPLSVCSDTSAVALAAERAFENGNTAGAEVRSAIRIVATIRAVWRRDGRPKRKVGE